MGFLFGRLFAPRGNGLDPPEDRAHAPDLRTAYSDQYEVIVGQGHEHPTPSFGPPALVWHVGVWPKKDFDPHNAKGPLTDPLDADARKTFLDRRGEALTLRRGWVTAIDAELARLQEAGRRMANDASVKSFITPGCEVPDEASIVFTLWWPPKGASNPHPGAIRVKVHCNLTPDYVTYSFYMDVRALWGGGQAATDGDDTGHAWRTTILQDAAAIREICATRASPGRTRYAQVDPDDLDATTDTRLLDARNRLYVEVWEAFCADFSLGLRALATDRGEVFANFRGLALSVPPLSGYAAADDRFPRFSEDRAFNRDGGEANAVVDAYWPFVRRVVPYADFREFVVCGLMSWRALYVTALGSPAQWDEGEERGATRGEKTEADILAIGSNANGVKDSMVEPRTRDTSRRNHPVRYLILTKENSARETLNPRQLGRIVERINALGTLRLYALKDWHAIAEADAVIRILGQELDEITRDWSEKRNLLDRLRRFRDFKDAYAKKEFAPIREYLADAELPTWLGRTYIKLRSRLSSTTGESGALVRGEEGDKVLDIKYALLAKISSKLEGKLLGIGSELDGLGKLATGGLHFRINRAAVHVVEFNQLLHLLQVGNVQTWTSYEQFVSRGLTPLFNFIEGVGRRTTALRARLNSVLEMIETSALVGQSSATRHNTARLRRIGVVVLLYVAAQIWANRRAIVSDVGGVVSWVAGLIRPWLGL